MKLSNPIEIVTSKSAKRMMDYILPIYTHDPYMLHLFEAIGKEIDELMEWVNAVEAQPFPQFATFTLPFWEESIGLSIGHNLSTEQRRSRIITRLSTYFPITKERMQMIAASAAGSAVEIEAFTGPYTFNIVLTELVAIQLKELIEEVKETKPAHLSFQVTQQVKTGFFLPAATLVGEKVTVYPWSPQQLELKGTARYAGTARSVETISIFPERGTSNGE